MINQGFIWRPTSQSMPCYKNSAEQRVFEKNGERGTQRALGTPSSDDNTLYSLRGQGTQGSPPARPLVRAALFSSQEGRQTGRQAGGQAHSKRTARRSSVRRSGRRAGGQEGADPHGPRSSFSLCLARRRRTALSPETPHPPSYHPHPIVPPGGAALSHFLALSPCSCSFFAFVS